MNQVKPLLVITGFADGLGTALAKKYIVNGYHVVTLARKVLSKDIQQQLGEPLTHYTVDLTRPEGAISVFDRLLDEQGTPNTVIHNVSQLAIAPFMETSIDTFISTWQTNCLSAAICSQMLLPAMKKNGGGSMIFTGATASIKGGDKFAAFASSKFALRGLSQSLAWEYGPKGIHIIHTLIDGLIWGPQTIERFNPPKENCLLPEDIAEAYFQLSQQPASAWSHEVDLRPRQREVLSHLLWR